MASYSVPIKYYDFEIMKRDQFLFSRDRNYQGNIDSHSIWHTVFIGFGYLNNRFGIEYKDENGIMSAQKINPNVVYLSKEYEAILKNLVFDFIIEEPHFVFSTIFAKMGHIFMYFLFYANIGLLCALFYRKNIYLDLSFAGALCFGALIGILSMPKPTYLFEFITFSAIFGIVSIDHAIKCGLRKDISNITTSWLKMSRRIINH